MSENLPDLATNPQFASVLAKYGIRKADITAPVARVTPKSGFEALCVNEYPIYAADEVTGELDTTRRIECVGHTGPLMYLDRDDTEDSSFDGSTGFMRLKVYHPQKGEMLVTYSLAEEGSDLTNHLNTLAPGNLFQVAHVRTRKNHKLFLAVPVQGS